MSDQQRVSLIRVLLAGIMMEPQFCFDLVTAGNKFQTYLEKSCPEKTSQLESLFRMLTSKGKMDKLKFLEEVQCTLANDKLFFITAHYFKPLLPMLIATKLVGLRSKKECDIDWYLEVENFTYCLSLLVAKHKQLKKFVIQLLKMQPFDALRKFGQNLDDNRVLRLSEALYNFMINGSKCFSPIINWYMLIDLLKHKSKQVRLNTWKACLLAHGIRDCVSLTRKHLEMNDRGLIVASGWTSSNVTFVKEQNDVNPENRDCPMEDDFRPEELYVGTDLRHGFVNVCGIVLPGIQNIIGNNIPLSDKMVLTATTIENVRSLALATLSGSPVLVEGPIGCGKTFHIEELARKVGYMKAPNIIKLQLGSQTDSKTLIGTYVCTKTPGEFQWQEGILSQAVRLGSWIILEDIDSAPPDVLSVLIPLVETNSLTIPGHGTYKAKSGHFRVFATRRSGQYVTSAHSFHTRIESLFTKVILQPLTTEELIEVVSTRFPSLKEFASKLVDIYSLIAHDEELKPTDDIDISRVRKGTRLFTTRDFIKWCTRISSRVTGVVHSVLDDIFPEALSCFCSQLVSEDDRLMVALAIGVKMNINKDVVSYYINCHKPVIERAFSNFTVGRVCLPKRKILGENQNCAQSIPGYAYTRHSLLLLEQLATCVFHNEPVLLVGETGCGKTATIQHLAAQCGNKLTVVNMSQQSDVTDLLGGFKPVSTRQIVEPVRRKFEELFARTFSRKQNVKFLGHIQQAFTNGEWNVLITLMQHCATSARKRQVKDGSQVSLSDWHNLNTDIKDVKKRIQSEKSLVFSFVEGALVKAIRSGLWILLDEVNLATSETLECLSSVLESTEGSLLLTDKGEMEPVVRDKGFRMFACMNPATDIGKKDIPAGIRNRFTEIYVDEMKNPADLKILVTHYLKDTDITSPLVDGIVRFFKAVQVEAKEKVVDGTGHQPHYSLRTLCRALEYASTNKQLNQLRAVYEGMCMSFLTQLHQSCHVVVESLIKESILGHCSNAATILSQPIVCPGDGSMFKRVGHFWIPRGTKEPYTDSKYIITNSVKDNLNILARVVSGRRCPILLQGETSVGKTSMIQYLAKLTGNHCVRINNHEHTDIQEYIGCYAADANGKLVFKEGVLIDAMRKGYWIILDELNLAPTDVLEALNRLLDDNRELYITETQEIVKAHENFMLLATQNPPGHYSGRKMLSRAFRNRFVELHFDEIPGCELQVILHKRCDLPLSYCKKFVAVMSDLQARRKSTGIFAGKHGFITLRDLFRWAERYRKSDKNEHQSRFFDWEQQLCEDGYMLLAGRCRKTEDGDVIKSVIENHFKKKIDTSFLFGQRDSAGSLTSKVILEKVCLHQNSEFPHLVWTKEMRRLAVLVGRALQFNEPVLLVGETGCGKTTICQLFALLAERSLFTVNCHMHTESADFLGGIRPVRDRMEQENERLFEWQDGPLVSAMKSGSFLLIDEISLADDSVLERLNSVLENERTLVLAEKGGAGDENEEEIEIITAKNGFRVIATMNPGGDFGKKELSPALRNRFVEIWCPSTEDRDGLISIMDHNLCPQMQSSPRGASHLMMDFIDWLRENDFTKRTVVSIRDILSWVHFINRTCGDPLLSSESVPKTTLTPTEAILHGCCLVFIDGIGHNASVGKEASYKAVRHKCIQYLQTKLGDDLDLTTADVVQDHPSAFGVKPFFIAKGNNPRSFEPDRYSMNTESTSKNAGKVLRGLQLDRPILLEGSPGAGKTSLVSALAKAAGHRLVRINLSEQTDISDLFGADLPTEGGKAGEFTWKDGPFLKALKEGQWVMLDELNLASQSVLEGLNACFDHRSEIYVSELGRAFTVKHDTTKLFACQNPLNQGGGRKGLPKSFLNRFTKVYIDPLTKDDLLFIVCSAFPSVDRDILIKMVQFNMKMHQDIVQFGLWGVKGGPWEFNIRDLLRWCELIIKNQTPECWNPAEFVSLIYQDRLRSLEDRKKVLQLYEQVFNCEDMEREQLDRLCQCFVTPDCVLVGHSMLRRKNEYTEDVEGQSIQLQLLRSQFRAMESLITCIDMNWMAIIVGPQCSGKTSILHSLAKVTGHTLKVLHMTSSMDTTELLGGFEQVNVQNHMALAFQEMKKLIRRILQEELIAYHDNNFHIVKTCLSLDQEAQQMSSNDQSNSPSGTSSQLLTGVKKMQDTLNSVSFSRARPSTAEALRELNLKLTDFEANFSSETTFSKSLGCFEWVDGELIHALKNGHWLLIDNVNFCSPSVLDRLNALLEPGGVLALDERGVIDGNIPIIKPHKDFRLFFAMDPKYGEISRAMRNRGIEIFLPGEADGASLDETDTRRIMKGAGLDSYIMQSQVMSVASEITGLPVTKVTKICKMIAELLERTTDMEGAVRLGFQEALRNSKLSSSEKEVKLQIVNDVLSREWLPMVDNEVLSLASCSVEDFWHDSVTTNIWKDVFPMLISTKEEKVFYLCIFLERATLEDFDLRGKFVSSLVQTDHFKDLILEIYNKVLSRENLAGISELVAEAQQLLPASYALNSFPIDIERCTSLLAILRKFQFDLTDGHHRNTVSKILPQILFQSKRLFQLLYREFDFAILSGSCFASVPTEPDNTSLLSVSSYFIQGLLSKTALPHPSVAHIKPLFDTIDEIYKRTVLLTDDCEDLIQLISTASKWAERFRHYCQRITYTHGSSSFPWQLMSLHWKWLKEEFLVPLFSKTQLLPGSSVMQTLNVIAGELDKTLGFTAVNDRLHPAVVSGLGEQLPFSNKDIFEMWVLAQTLSNKLKASHSESLKRLEEPGRNMHDVFTSAVAVIEEIVYLCGRSSHSNEQDLKSSVSDLLKNVESTDIRNIPSSLSSACKEKLSLQVQQFLMFHLAISLNQSFQQKQVVSDDVSHFTAFSVRNGTASPLDVALLRTLAKSVENKSVEGKSLLQPLLVSAYADCKLMDEQLNSTQLNSNITVPHKVLPKESKVLTLNTSYTSLVSNFLQIHFSFDKRGGNIKHSLRLSADIASLEDVMHDVDSFIRWLWMNGGSLHCVALSVMFSSCKWALLSLAKIAQPLFDKNIFAAKLDIEDIELNIPASKSFEKLLAAALAFLRQIPSDGAGMGDIFMAVKPLILLLEEYSKVVAQETDLSLTTHTSLKLLYLNGLVLTLTGSLIYAVGLPYCPFDPVEEKKEKLKYLSHESEIVTQEMKTRYIAEHYWTGSPELTFQGAEPSPTHFTSNPFRVKALLARDKKLRNDVINLQCGDAYRPNPSQFEEVMGAFKDFRASIGNSQTILSMANKAKHVFDTYFHSISSGINQSKTTTGLPWSQVLATEKSLEAWCKSAGSFLERLNKEFIAYRDLFSAAAVGLSQVIFGIKIILHNLQQLKSDRKSLDNDDRRVSLLSSHLSLLPQDAILPWDADISLAELAQRTLLSVSSADVEGGDEESAAFQARCVYVTLQYIQLDSALHGYLRDEAKNALCQLLQFLSVKWVSKKEKEQQKEIEESTIFKTRIKNYSVNENDGVVEEEEHLRTFWEDFDDVLPKEDFGDTNKDSTERTYERGDESLEIFDCIDFGKFHELFHSIVSDKTKSDLDLLSRFIESYTVVMRYAYQQYVDYAPLLDAKFTPAHVIAMNYLKNEFEGEASRKCSKDGGFDIYNNSSIVETRKLYLPLRNFKLRITELLASFPDHPALQQILKIVDKLYSIPSSAPVMKFITGLEILLQQSQNWESYASSNVSIRKNLEEITELVIEWRKLELRCWPKLLDDAQGKVVTKACTWLPSLFAVVDHIGTANMSNDDLTVAGSSFQKFIQSSSVGEFQTRLNLIKTIAGYVKIIHFRGLHQVLWNLYKYYAQFLPRVDEFICAQRKPIENELKDFVKIARWNDINFWAMKQATEKSHRTLRKFITRFKNVLMEPVAPHLRPTFIKDSEFGNTGKQWHNSLPIKDFVLNIQDKIMNEDKISSQGGNADTELIKKARRKMTTYLKRATHEAKTTDLDEFTGAVIENMKELSSTELETVPKEKKGEFIKNLQNRKRRGLVMLFKTCTSIGLSYRKGVRMFQGMSDELDILMPIIDTSSLSCVDGFKALVDEADHYMFYGLAKFSDFCTALSLPSKELSPADVSRCKGFTSHLLSVVKSQRSYSSKFLALIEQLRSDLRELRKLKNSTCVNYERLIPSQTEARQILQGAKELLDDAVLKVEGFNLLLQSAPKTMPEEGSPLPPDFVPPAASWIKDSVEYSEVVKTIEAHLLTLRKHKSQIDHVMVQAMEISQPRILTWDNIGAVLSADKILQCLKDSTLKIVSHFTLPKFDPATSFASVLVALNRQIDDYHYLLAQSDVVKVYLSPRESKDDIDDTVMNDQEQTRRLHPIVQGALFAIQKLFKYQESLAEEDTSLAEEETMLACSVDKINSVDQDTAQDTPQDHLEGLLLPTLCDTFLSEINCLDIEKVSHRLRSLVNEVCESCSEFLAVSARDLTLIVPILDQFLKATEYFAARYMYLHRTCAKMFSVLVGLWTQLLREGFCVPPEETEGAGEGATQFEDIKGGGIGEGEGAKDVSNEIEDESQLEETKKDVDGSDQEDEGPDNIPNEDNGIEMTDDFESKLQDVDEDESTKGDSEDDNEEENDLDDAAGKVDGEDEEQLDEKFWGDSGDESDLDENGDEKQGPGSDAVTDSELVAKDDHQGEQEGKENETKADEENKEDETKQYEDSVQVDEDGEQEEKDPKDFEIPENLDLDQANEDIQSDHEEKNEDEGVDNGEDFREDNEITDQEEVAEDDEKTTEEEETGGSEMEMPTENEEGKEPECLPSEESEMNQESQVKDDKKNNVPQQSGGYDGMEMSTTSSLPSDQASEHQQKEGDGAAMLDEQMMESGRSSSNLSETPVSSDRKNSRKDFGRSREDRTLADATESRAKRQKTVDKMEGIGDEENNQEKTSDLYSHVKDNEHWDELALDTASREQASRQNVNRMEDENETNDEESSQLFSADQEGITRTGGVAKENAGEEKHVEDDEEKIDDQCDDADLKDETIPFDKAGVFPTSSFFSSGLESLNIKTDEELEDLRRQLECQLTLPSSASESGDDKEAMDRWMKYELLTTTLSQQLCEQLRLILEPTQASKLQGDYRTGKRLNMRKVIPYIASRFRKDKIWLRRTKKSKRNYQVMIAVDDSASMVDNHSKQIAFESLAVISNALTWLEVGELSVCRFGETVELVHQFNEAFNAEAGGRILKQFTFQQSKTHVAALLNACTRYLMDERIRIGHGHSFEGNISQLLLIISDGRGIFLEGKDVVKKSVRLARESGVFVVFIIIDDPTNRDSILDIQVPIFNNGSLEIKSYMEEFPFPFYLILNNINALPTVLSDALRQWFELVAAE